MLDTHPFFIPPCVFCMPDRLLQSDVGALESKSSRSPVLPTLSSSPSTKSISEVPRQEASPFRSLLIICASLLKATLYSRVCAQILLLPLTCVSRDVVFEPSWPLACIKQLVIIFIIRVVLWYSYRGTLFSIVYPACMITIHYCKLGASQLCVWICMS